MLQTIESEAYLLVQKSKINVNGIVERFFRQVFSDMKMLRLPFIRKHGMNTQSVSVLWTKIFG
jgi:hypothetical protein